MRRPSIYSSNVDHSKISWLKSMVWAKFFLSMAITMLLFSKGFTQELRQVTRLPDILDETSGIEITGENRIWSFNDSGGEPELYLFDTSGNLIKTILIENAWNRDWEDISQDTLGNFYIGNIGNNDNDNTDLTIFKIPNPDEIPGSSVQADIISFSYEDQFSFPPPDDSLFFDCEALMWRKGSLYLSTKSRTIPFDGKTHLYQLPDTAGHYIAKKLAIWDTGGNDIATFWITAGDFNTAGDMLTLLSSNKMWIFYNFEGTDFFGGQKIQIDFNNATQKEAISFVNNQKVYITDEEWFGGIGRNLYAISLDSVTTSSQYNRHQDVQIKIWPNPCHDHLIIENQAELADIEIYNAAGKRFDAPISRSGTLITIETALFPQGVFFIKMRGRASHRIQVNRIIKMTTN